MSTPKIRILRKWQDFFKLTAKEKALSRMGGKGFLETVARGARGKAQVYKVTDKLSMEGASIPKSTTAHS